jgi:hypothetical protein
MTVNVQVNYEGGKYVVSATFPPSVDPFVLINMVGLVLACARKHLHATVDRMGEGAEKVLVQDHMDRMLDPEGAVVEVLGDGTWRLTQKGGVH